MLSLRKNLVAVFFGVFIMLTAGAAMADTSVSWLTPLNGSTYADGTVLGTGRPDGAFTGVANGVGQNGGAGLDLALVIDRSGSMRGNRLAQAKTAAIALVNNLPEDTTSVAVIGFSSSSYAYTTLTTLNPNKEAVIAAINSIIAGGGTNLGVGVTAGTTALVNDHTAGRAMMQVVLSDGQGAYSAQAETAFAAHGIVTHTVGVPGHNTALMQQIATDGHGVYTNVTDIDNLVGVFNGTGGNLVGLDHVDIQLADGTWINDIATDALGNFVLPDQLIASGVNTFTAYAFGTDGTSASAALTLNGGPGGGPAPVPEPSTMLLMASGLIGLWGFRKKFKKR